MRWTLFSLLSLALLSCQSSQPTATPPNLPPEDRYEASLNIQGNELNFFFDLEHEPLRFVLDNVDERFDITDFTLTEDSLIVPLHIFDTQLKAAYADGKFSGHWIKNYADGYALAFEAEKAKTQEPATEVNASTLASRYRVYFESELEDSTVAVAEFKQEGNQLKGTFLTQTGDYRYLNGSIEGGSLKLSTFDGEHAFVFTGELGSDGAITGLFASGKTWHEQWWAYPDEDVTLASASTLTYLKDDAKTLHFEGKALDNSTWNLDAPSLQGRPFILQIMGSWCPNCMDETKYLSQWYENRTNKELEIVSLAFERKNNFKYAQKQLSRLKERYGISYPLLFGGSYDKKKAAQTLPELNTVVAYPTLVFYNANHEVTHIHTGFTGPGTGEHFERWKLDFEKRVSEIAP